MLGPSGSGKTTTLRMIAGFELPTAGRIHLHGRDVTTVPPFDRDVNTVFQDYALFPHLTVGDNVGYGLVVRKVPKAAAPANGSPRSCGWSASRATSGASPSQLSGGQRQRVALARALVNRPRVLLLDEPLGALDLKLREEMQIELKAIQQAVGITFIYVTHDQEEALTMSDRMAVFNAGRIEQLGSPADVYERPEHPLRGGLRRNLEPAHGSRGGTGPGTDGHVHDPPREDPPGRGRDASPGRTRPAPPGTSATSSTSAPTPATRDPRRRRQPGGHATEPRDVLDRGARAAGQGCPPDLEATARAPHRGWDQLGRRTRRPEEEERSHGISQGAGRAHGPDPARRRV